MYMQICKDKITNIMVIILIMKMYIFVSSQATTSVMCLMLRKGAGTALMILVFPRQQNQKSGPVEREADTYSSTSTSKLFTSCRT